MVRKPNNSENNKENFEFEKIEFEVKKENTLNISELKNPDGEINFVMKEFPFSFKEVEITGADTIACNVSMPAFNVYGNITLKGQRVSNYLRSLQKGKTWQYVLRSLVYYLFEGDRRLGIYRKVKK